MVDLGRLAAIVTALDANNYDSAHALAQFKPKRQDAQGWTGTAGSVLSAPSNDSFYNILDSSQIQGYALGDVIKSRPVGGFSDNKNLSAYQIVYRSENSHGDAVGALTTILIPLNNDQKHVVVFPQPEDSSYIDCASSYSLLEGGLGAQINLFLSAGYVVNIPDHEGFNSSFVAGVLEGKLTLDSIRALEASRNLTNIDNSEYVIVGYSGGSIATGWAAELQASYAPDLNIKGFSMGGYVASPRDVWLKVNKTPYVGFLPAAVMGLASEYTDLWDLLDTAVAPNKTSDLLDALMQCVDKDIVQYYNQDFFEYFSEGEGILEVDQVASTIEAVTLGKTVPGAAMFIYNGVSDQIVPIESVDKVVDFYCSGGASVVYNRGAGKDHVGMAYAAAVELYEWVGQVFAGNVSSGCSFEGVYPSFANSSANSSASSSTNTSASASSSTNTNTSSSTAPATANKASKRLPNLLAILIGFGFILL